MQEVDFVNDTTLVDVRYRVRGRTRGERIPAPVTAEPTRSTVTEREPIAEVAR